MCSFAFLIGGGPFEVLGSLLGGWVGQIVRRLLLGRHYNHFGVVMLAGTAASLVYRAEPHTAGGSQDEILIR